VRDGVGGENINHNGLLYIFGWKKKKKTKTKAKKKCIHCIIKCGMLLHILVRRRRKQEDEEDRACISVGWSWRGK